MAIKEIFEKLMNAKAQKGLTANEVELNSYLEEERLDNIKKLLHKMRVKKNQEILFSNTLVSGGQGILDSPNVITKEEGSRGQIIPKKVFDHKNLFFM